VQYADQPEQRVSASTQVLAATEVQAPQALAQLVFIQVM
jgi:hypothetical protein